jgi:hypothetical protein
LVKHISRYLVATTGIVTIVSGCLLAPPLAASATESPASQVTPLSAITPDQFDQAVVEARSRGLVESDSLDAHGTRTISMSLGDGITVDVVQPTEARLSPGSDGYGKYVSFNNFDQDAIISGGLWGLSAGLCVVSAGVFCVVAGAILTAAALAISANHGGKCSSGKALRVYPFSGHKPRCA